MPRGGHFTTAFVSQLDLALIPRGFRPGRTCFDCQFKLFKTMSLPTIKILVCGGGNGAHTLAGTAAAISNVEVRIITLFADEAERWSKILESNDLVVSITYNNGTASEIRSKPKFVTKDPAIAVPGTDIIFFTVPAFAHQQYFDAILPFVEPNTIIAGLPGQAGFEFQAINTLKNVVDKCAILSCESLPWACRLLEFGKKVQIQGFKESLSTSLILGHGQYKLPPLELVQKILGERPKIVQAKNYLAVNLMAKSIVHPPIMYGKWCLEWDGEPLKFGAPLFYQGVNDVQADLLSKVSDEIVCTANKIQQLRPEFDMSEIIHIFDWYIISYRDQISDASNLKMAMRTNKAYNGLLHPMRKENGDLVPDFSYRYITEDIPFGLVVMKGIAEIVGVETPTMDKIIKWAQEIMGKEFLIRSELKGKDLKCTRAPQAFGFKTLDELLNV
ncbi:hypothetical protein CHS0354_024920 [Potamilus streckersoni]|uniref:Opine dehydrogenase domain-containing protein n=1 Tax=Potamilus streckersoni TaxID=2493646 RepID=A0AAE0S443_9BIVA|nr:hypothetical protein CHS0354_024920 [Potamilus streckersoni]